ncbi:EFR1 family ferrodoxin, partial [uncultured Robinsoniella sp.]|uniref:EFR1 family ferrodoxin n=1 Tax=uncultured Robinsoniella sp. TaxID=904190 RepID=UPI00374FBD0E
NSLKQNKILVHKADAKTKEAVHKLKAGNPPWEGLGSLSRLAGLFGQRLYFLNKTKRYTDKLKINTVKCIGCGKCEKLCPLGNITLQNGTAISGNTCTMCYRCINQCPKQAITLLGKRVYEQNSYSKKY